MTAAFVASILKAWRNPRQSATGSLNLRND